MKRQPRSSPRSHKTLRTVSIVGTGSYVPENVLTNEDLSRMVDTSDEWITTRTGIKERRIAAKDENTSDMAAKAALKAIEQAKISPTEIDLSDEGRLSRYLRSVRRLYFRIGNRTTVHHVAHVRHRARDRCRQVNLNHQLVRS